MVSLPCGNAQTGSYPDCLICGYGFEVGNPEAVVSIPGQPSVPCSGMEDAGLNGRISEGACELLPGYIFDDCECKSSDNGPQPTEAPVAPTPPPVTTTPEPSAQPVAQSTPEPSVQQTDEPTADPTADPTPAPVVEPTLTPVAEPTLSPVLDPTESPVSDPTQSPVPDPTSSPVPDPTPTPVLDPTGSPDSDPTESPVPDPSGSPVSDPTENPNSPSGSPTISPSTETLSFTPTTSPSQGLTKAPSGLPSTSSPTRDPTISPSPSSSPTLLPSGVEPTASPLPTESTEAPTDFPTASPSAETKSPTLILQKYLIPVVVLFEGITQELDASSKITFQTETAGHIKDSFLPDLDDLIVGTRITNEDVLLPANTRGRRLQTTTVTVTTLMISFDTAIEFRSPTDNLDVESLVAAAFDTDEERNVYLTRLQNEGGQTFLSVTSVTIEVGGSSDNVKKEETASATASTGVGLPVIIGASVGGAALLAILVFIILRKRKPATYNDDNYTFGSSKKDLGNEHVNTNILVEPQDDISTLGDPMPGVVMLQQDDVSTLGEPIVDAALDKDDTATRSSVSADYDFHKSFAQQGHQQSEGSLSLDRPGAFRRVNSDGLSIEESINMDEQRFEVCAPAGKLGMVIDTPGGGAPVVHAIKSTSSLANTGIQVGDRLVAIDGIDTTSLTAMQVSKLISQKANNPSRVLHFVRNQNVGFPQ